MRFLMRESLGDSLAKLHVLLSMRVSRFVSFFQPSRADMRINLSCRQAFMTQQFLHTA